MKVRHAAQLLSLAAVVAACGAEARVVQPRGCFDGYNRVPENPSAGDVRAGGAWFPALDASACRHNHSFRPRPRTVGRLVW